jgi:hypothetical protein
MGKAAKCKMEMLVWNETPIRSHLSIEVERKDGQSLVLTGLLIKQEDPFGTHPWFSFVVHDSDFWEWPGQVLVMIIKRCVF